MTGPGSPVSIIESSQPPFMECFGDIIESSTPFDAPNLNPFHPAQQTLRSNSHTKVGRNTVTDGDPVTVTGNGADSLLPSMIGPCYRRTLCDWTAVAASSPLPPQQGGKRGLCSFGSKFPAFVISPRAARCPSAPLAVAAASPSTTPCSLPTGTAPRLLGNIVGVQAPCYRIG